MIGALPMALLLIGLLAAAGTLAVIALREGAGRARIHLRAHGVTASGIAGRRGGVLLREPDPLLGGSVRSAADRWLLEHLGLAAGLDARLREAELGMRLAPFVALVLGGVAVLLLGFMLAGAGSAMAALLALAGGGMLPWLLLRTRIARRRKAFERLLPEAIGLMVRGLRAGVPVSETVAEVGAEVIDPVGGAFRRAHEQVLLGQPLETALLAETAALQSPSMAFLIVTISVQRETGGNLAETLDKLDDIMRRRDQMQLKVKAMSSEAKASALIIGSLPIIMAAIMAFVAPDYILPLFTTTAGQVLLGGALLSLGIGGWLMAQLVAFDV